MNLIKMHQNIIRIAITGPESTGKSTLSRQLAAHFKTAWVPEFARDYIAQLEREYSEEDLLEIARGQLDSEDKMMNQANQMIFCDTELTVIKIWSEYKFKRVHPWILSKYNEVDYDLYLLTDVDLPWKYDPQRENPEKGSFFFDWFKKTLHEKKANYEVIKGNEVERLKNAIRIVDNWLNTKSF